MRRAGGDEDASPLQAPAARQQPVGGGEYLGRFGHPPGPELAAGHVALIRADHMDAVAGQHRQIALRRRVLPHPHVHRGRDQHGLVRRHKQGGGEVIRMPPRHLRHQIGGGGRDDQQIGGAGKLDMPHLRLVGQIEKVLIDLLSGQRGNRQGRHELGRRAGHHAGNAIAPLPRAADQLKALIGGDAAADYQKDAFGLTHSRPVRASAIISRVRGVVSGQRNVQR